VSQQLADRSLGELSMMTSSGNVVPGAEAAANPVRMIESGPAAGALGAGRYAALAGHRPILAFDMGGTTAKLCVLRDGKPVIAHGLEVDRRKRFMEGSGIPLGIQSVKLIEVGAGGGSIAHVDHLGLLAIGPHSAGAEPGPVCYGRGGSAATVTDADLVRGFLDAERFLGGRMTLDLPAARAAVARLALDLGSTPQRCAWGIHELANEMMARSAATQALESGVDPSECVMVAFGGAGPTHAHGIASRLGIDTVVYPAGAGIATALGLLGAPLAYYCAQTLFAGLGTADLGALREAAERLLRRSEKALGRTVVSHQFSADMRYVGQGYELTVPVDDPLEAATTFADTARDAFTVAYRRLYLRELAGREVELTVLRLTAVAEPAGGAGLVRREGGRPRARSRGVATRPGEYGDHAVVSLADLGPDVTLAGPAMKSLILAQNERWRRA
jgi:N-methylhydantoinase A